MPRSSRPRIKITARLVYKVMLLRILLLVTLRRPKSEDCDENVYRELSKRFESMYRNDSSNIKRSEITSIICDKLGKLPDLTHAQILTPYPQLRAVGTQLELSQIEQIILLIVVWIRQDKNWDDIRNILGKVDRGRLAGILARLIKISNKRIAAALSMNGKLIRSGLLINQVSGGRPDIEDHFDVLEGVNEQALRYETEWERMIVSAYSDTARCKLTLNDYPHLGDKLRHITNLLQGALAAKTPGVHVLLYGPPGTGKTELARALARHLKARLRSVKSASLSGDEMEGMSRFRAYRFGQALFKGSGATLFLFDEMEDVFPSHFGAFFRDSGAFHKGYLNQELEEATLPTIWTANDIYNVDPAHLRRFSYILEVPPPPREIRARLLGGAVKGSDVSEDWLLRMVDHEELTPAEIAQLGSITKITGASGLQAENMMETIFSEKMIAMGNEPVRAAGRAGRIRYDLDYLNLDTDPRRIIDGLQPAGTASLLFYGPPGTGKSELARHLSRQLARPVHIKRASDLLDKYVGGTERKISLAFRKAEREKAILFLDEADSFLRSRESAHRSWEVTQVNEMLVQMENFNGVFIAATNLIDNFDMAAFRRFDMKIRFSALDAEQRWKMFVDLLEQKPSAELGDYCKGLLRELDALTAGDFRAAVRNLDIRRTSVTAESLLAALKEEARFKNLETMNKLPIGFVRH